MFTKELIFSFSLRTVIALFCLYSTFGEILCWGPKREWVKLMELLSLSKDLFDVSIENSSNFAKLKLEACNSW